MEFRNVLKIHAVNANEKSQWYEVGEYDLSEDKLKDSVRIKPPKLTD
jgi:hypothetical protein